MSQARGFQDRIQLQQATVLVVSCQVDLMAMESTGLTHRRA